jgi:hypothetical protein
MLFLVFSVLFFSCFGGSVTTWVGLCESDFLFVFLYALGSSSKTFFTGTWATCKIIGIKSGIY